MAYGAVVDPVAGTVITVAYFVANALDPIRWLRLLTGNADPPGTAYVVVSTSTSGTSWQKVPADALAAGVAVANLGYTPANVAGQVFSGAISAPSVIAGAGGMASGAGISAVDVVASNSLQATGAVSGASAAFVGLMQSATATITGLITAGSATVTGLLTAGTAAINGTMTITKAGPAVSPTMYTTSHAYIVATGNTAPSVGLERSGISAGTLYELGSRPRWSGADGADGPIAFYRTGTYTGDGTTNRQITTGFPCKSVVIIGGSAGPVPMIHLVSATVTRNASFISSATPILARCAASALHSSDGFVVSAGADAANDSPIVYTYVAIGG